MTLYSVMMPNPRNTLQHLDSLWNDVPKDVRRFKLAKLRARRIIAKFYKSNEFRPYAQGETYTALFLQLVFVHHAATVDELTPDIVRDVASRFVLPDDAFSFAYWTTIIHEELVAFFRMLERRGEPFAKACLSTLEDEIHPAYEAKHLELNEACATPLPETALLTMLSSMKAPSTFS